MTITVLQAWEAVCPSCTRWVRFERVRTDVPGTKEVVISRCPMCNRVK